MAEEKNKEALDEDVWLILTIYTCYISDRKLVLDFMKYKKKFKEDILKVKK